MFKRLVVVRILRPDKVVQTIQKLIKKDNQLGKNFITPPPFNLDKVFNDSTNKTPIIMVLSAGADPMTELQKLSDRKKIKFL
jgi:dynein heavy chain